jgi:hypothetical protein
MDVNSNITGVYARPGFHPSADGTRIWAGRIADSFYIDLSLLVIVNGAITKGTALDLSGWRPEKAQNSFEGTSVESIVLEVPHSHPRLRPGARTGVWPDGTEGYGKTVARLLLPRHSPLRGRHPGHVRLRRPQGPDTGRQRARGDDVARHRHRRALGTAAVRLRAGAQQRLPVRRPGLTRPDHRSARPDYRSESRRREQCRT